MSDGQHRTSGINNSSSKHHYAFSKSSRFASPSQYTGMSCYDHKSVFSGSKSKPVAGFSSGSKRFGNTGVGNADINNWGPHGANYYQANFSGQMGKINSSTIPDLKNSTASYTFGVGRDNMRKEHVDKIIKATDGYTTVPGSGTYEYNMGFGGSSHNETTCFSMRKKLNMDELHLEKSKKLPGPG